MGQDNYNPSHVKGTMTLNRLQLLIFSCTLFLSAGLMFGLQPMVGKMLLPLVGGTPSGWIVAMAFFQVMLLAGYLLAHLLSRFSPRIQVLLYIFCLGIGTFFLPVALARYSGLLSSSPTGFEVFLLLSVSVAIPFAALSATASTLQRLFTTTSHHSAEDPYFLYAASNLGSFTGLLLYPFFIESRSTLTAQSHGWLLGYILLIILAAACLFISGREMPVQKKVIDTSPPLGWKTRLEWIALALIPSGLLLAVTMHITTDIFSVPLLWVIPLGIYLLTFVVAFSKKPLINYQWILELQPIAAAVAVALTLMVTDSMALSWNVMEWHLAAFAIVALMCHMRLARSRPAAHRHLTEFYLMMAIGGALGGILVAFAAPLLFNRLVEYPLLMAASGLLSPNIRARFSGRYVYAFFAACVLLSFFCFLRVQGKATDFTMDLFLIVIFALITLHPRLSVLGGIVVFLGVSFYSWVQPTVFTMRDFYGVLKVFDRQEAFTFIKTPLTVRYLKHGTTLHGFQILGPEYETTPTTYYTREGPLGDMVTFLKPKTIAAVGLGTGTINCYGTPDRKITFFEIDPAVVKIAKERFTYLSKCGAGMPRIIVGDARLELKKLEGEKFDLIILDAFSSDTVPTHLLTKEAVQVYLQRLAPGGVILFHISNRYFNLYYPIAAAGEWLGLKNSYVHQGSYLEFYAAASKWVALTRPDVDLSPLAKTNWTQDVLLPWGTKPWTDDYTDLMGALNWYPHRTPF